MEKKKELLKRAEEICKSFGINPDKCKIETKVFDDGASTEIRIETKYPSEGIENPAAEASINDNRPGIKKLLKELVKDDAKFDTVPETINSFKDSVKGFVDRKNYNTKPLSGAIDWLTEHFTSLVEELTEEVPEIDEEQPEESCEDCNCGCCEDCDEECDTEMCDGDCEQCCAEDEDGGAAVSLGAFAKKRLEERARIKSTKDAIKEILCSEVAGRIQNEEFVALHEDPKVLIHKKEPIGIYIELRKDTSSAFWTAIEECLENQSLTYQELKDLFNETMREFATQNGFSSHIVDMIVAEGAPMLNIGLVF